MVDKQMKQYCRYCVNAIDYNGEATDFICTADATCGNNGAGRMYSAKKAKKTNRCRHFEFNPLDVFYTTYGYREYKPRGKYMYAKVSNDEEQLIMAFADTSQELADILGVKQKTVLKGVERYEKGLYNSPYRRIDINGD